MKIDNDGLVAIPPPGFMPPPRRWYRALGKGPWVWIDGRFVPESEPLFTAEEWLYAGMNSIVLEAVAYGTQLRFSPEIYSALQDRALLAGLPFPVGLTHEALTEAVKRLLNKNRYFGLVHLQFTLFLQPLCAKNVDIMPLASLLITSRSVGKAFYQMGSPYLVGLYEAMRREVGPLGGIRGVGDPILFQAARLLRLKKLHECLLLNRKGNVASAIRGKLYIVESGGLAAITPPEEEGGLYLPVEHLMPEVLSVLGVKSLEEDSISIRRLNNAQHLLLLSAADGLQRVLGVENKRYFLQRIEPAVEKLNRLCFPEYFE